MIDIFGNIKALFKIHTVTIDNNVFRLHYQLTLAVLLLFSIIVNSRQYFGDPIDCTVHNKDFERVIDNYCWSHLFVSKAKRYGSSPAQQAAFQGNDKEAKSYLFHYQWVGFILFFQAFLFFIPRFLWKFCWEEEKIKGLTVGMKMPIFDADVQMQKTRSVMEYFTKNKGNHRFYFFKYIICEILNLVNVVSQICMMDSIFGHVFSIHTFSEILGFMITEPDKRTDEMHWVFPQIAECELTAFSYNGKPMNHLSLCVVPVNIFNEKLYIILWFWFILLTVVSALGLVYRVATILFPQVRAYVILRKTKTLNLTQVKMIVQQVEIGDWFLLYLIGKNVEPIIFADLLKELNNKFGLGNDEELSYLKYGDEIETKLRP